MPKVATNTRQKLAVAIAEHISGIDDPNPQQDDYDLADKVMEFVDSEWDKKYG